MEYIFWNKSLIHIYIYQSYKEYHILKDTHITHFLLGTVNHITDIYKLSK